MIKLGKHRQPNEKLTGNLAGAAASEGSSTRKTVLAGLKKALASSNSWIILITLAIVIILSVLSPVFLTVANLQNILKQVAVTALIAAGMTMVIISGGIDLSVGSVLALSGVSVAMLIRAGVPEVLSILLGLLVGTGLGVLNGVVIARGHLPPFIATLGMMGMARGLALVLTRAESFAVLSPVTLVLGTGKVLGLPLPIIIVIAVYIISYYIMNHMRLGRYIFSIGGNEEAAGLSGVNVTKYKTVIYGICGLFSSLAGIVMLGRLASAPPTVATGAEMDAIAAVIIGGTSFAGGIGSIGGTIIGALIMSILANGFNLLNISSFWQMFFIGAIIIVSVWIDGLRHRRK